MPRTVLRPVPPWTPPRSLRGRIGLALAALMIGASVVLALAMSAFVRDAMLDGARQGIETLARQTARELSFGMDRFVREIELQATHPVFTDPGSSPGRMREALEAIQRVYPEFAHVSVIDAASETVIAATGGIFEGGRASGRPVFEEGRRGLFVADVHDAVRLASLLPRPASGEPLRFLDAAAPIRGADGVPFRVLASHLSWEWAHALRDRVLEPIAAGRRVEILLVDTAGAVVLPPVPSVPMGTPLARLVGDRPPAGAGAWADGAEYLTAEAATFASGAFRGLGWRVLVRQPTAVVLVEARRLRDLFLVGGAVLGLAAAAIGWAVTGMLVRPFSDLARVASDLRAGRAVQATTSRDRDPVEVATVRAAMHEVTGEALERAQRLLGELAALYRDAPVGLCVVDAALRYRRSNAVWDQAFGGRDGAQGGAGLPRALVDALCAAIDEGRTAAVEVEGRDGDARIWQVVVAPLREADGATGGASVVATDVTAIRRAERALRLADERKDRFLSMLAHELRNPLSPLVNGLRVLDRVPEGEQARQVRQMMRHQLGRVVRMVDDLLDVSRVSLGKIALKPEAVSPPEIVATAVESLRHLADARGQSIETRLEPGLPRIRGDRVRLEQVVCNLLANAIKFGRDGGRVRLSASAREGLLRIEVEDDGRGIDPAFLPHAFETFAQEDATDDRPDSGLGIGLALVSHLVALHGGRVEAHSGGIGRGARFVVELPLDAPVGTVGTGEGPSP
ncbi:MAG TPA: ATP-binding protein [Burkholderiaceae bacterium]|nr:ATP-binding protein [Burkholderiaceae bacterium]